MTAAAPPDRRLERLIFFSDAVFAIAITLLVIDLRPPDLPENASPAQFSTALADLIPAVLAYALSFAVIGLYWLAHVRRMHWIARVDERLLVLNLVLLGFIAFIPFPTALIGEFGSRAGVVVIYAVSVSIPGLLGPASWVYAARHGLAIDDVTPAMIRFGALRGLAVPIVMMSSLILLPFFEPWVVQMTWLLIFVVQLAIARRFRPPEMSV